MKHILGALLLIAIPFSCTTTPTCAAEQARITPKHHFRMGYVPDRHFPAGVKAFEYTPLKDTPILPNPNLAELMTPDDNQGQVGECTGHGLARAMGAAAKKATGSFTLYSPKFIYYNERVHMGTVDQDSGARIGEDGIFTLQQQGACLLTDWDMNQNYLQQPPPCAYTDGATRLVLHAYKVDNRNGQDLERAISAGFPVVYGIVLHSEFENLNRNSYVYHGVGDILGGHCMVFYEYNLTSTVSPDGLAPHQIRSHNQWGPDWGNNDTYDADLSIAHGSDVDDCYVIDAVKVPVAPTVKKRFDLLHFLHLR